MAKIISQLQSLRRAPSPTRLPRLLSKIRKSRWRRLKSGTKPTCTQTMGYETARSTSSNTSPSMLIHPGSPVNTTLTCVLFADGLHSPKPSRQRPTTFSGPMFLCKEQPSVGHHIVPPGSRPRRYSRTASFRRLQVHKSTCASLQQIRATVLLAVLRTDSFFFSP